MSIGDEPAFPCVTEEYDHNSERWKIVADGYGITLRDYFAAKAMQGWTANPLPNDSSIQDVAAWAYRQADAMIKAREVK